MKRAECGYASTEPRGYLPCLPRCVVFTAYRQRGSARHRLEDVLALLTSAGFTGNDALHIYRVLFGYLYGHILNELQEVVERPEETDDVLRLGLHRLTITEFPQLRALAPALASYDGANELDRFLDLLLPGLTTSFTHTDRSPQPHEATRTVSSRERRGE